MAFFPPPPPRSAPKNKDLPPSEKNNNNLPQSPPPQKSNGPSLRYLLHNSKSFVPERNEFHTALACETSIHVIFCGRLGRLARILQICAMDADILS